MMNEGNIDNPEADNNDALIHDDEIVDANGQNHADPEPQRSVWSDRINLGVKVCSCRL